MRKEEILREMKQRGKRVTEQRKLLLDIILENPHTCCKEIYYEAAKKDPSIGIATVYRMMNMLEELGAVNRFYGYPLYQCQEQNSEPESGIAIVNGRKLCKEDRELLYENMKILLEENGVLENGNQKFAATIVVNKS